MAALQQQKTISLHFLISASIIFCMIILSVALVSTSYFSNRSSLIKQVERSALLMTQAVDSGIVQITKPVIKIVQLLELDPLSEAKTIKQRLTRLPTLVRTLEMNKLLSAVYFGYPDGDFFLLRTVRSKQLKTKYGLSPQAAFLLQAIDRNVLGEIEDTQWIVYDKDINPINHITPKNYNYDPRVRPWFIDAKLDAKTIITPPYIFFTTKEVGLTFAQQNKKNQAIIGVDAALGDLSRVLRVLNPSAQSEIALMDNHGFVIGYPDANQLIKHNADGSTQLANINDLNVPALTKLAQTHQPDNHITKIKVNNQSWYGLNLSVGQEQGSWQLLYAIPDAALFHEINKSLLNQLIISIVIIILLLLLSNKVAKKISKSLLELSKDVNALTNFDFSRKINITSRIREVKKLAQLTSHMATTIETFQAISKKLSQGSNLDLTLDHIVQHLLTITQAKDGVVYLCTNKHTQLTKATSTKLECPKILNMTSSSFNDAQASLKQQINVENKHLFLSPLIDHNNIMLGILVLEIPDHDVSIDNALTHFIEEISGSAATAISTRKHFEDQQNLLDSIIKLLADAIDAKSPYTSGHCERVPVLAELIIDSLIDSNEQKFESFRMSKQQRREFRTAAWLHDCGKITSPEYVVDKATKLETINNRIHEIRTRFEVLWRDNEIVFLEGLLKNSNENKEQLTTQRDNKRVQLQNEFSLIAKANVGCEFMSDAKSQMIKNFGKQKWQRNFSKLIGLSQEETTLIVDKNEQLPVIENLLEDKPEHLISWGSRIPAVEKDNPENIWGFDMTLPKHAFNKGELHNLCISKGTLNPEERFLMNNHMVQTIKMLSALPFPDDLANVPNIAGNHHECLDGTGYPRKLDATELTTPERVMAIADIFEALTACDRPYKEAKTISQTMNIMANMAKKKQIDASIFEVFLSSGVYKQYAKKYLALSQIDEIDIQAIILATS